MITDEVRLGSAALKQFAKEVFVRVGLPPEDAELQADVLLWANLRGVDSHGVLRIPWYVDFVDKGQMKTRPIIRVERETPATALLEADYAFGPIVTMRAMNLVMEKARQVGIGWALIRNTMHQGAMGYYPLKAAEAGMAGIAFVCSPPSMAPYGARSAGVHNSPIAIAVPGKRRRPLVLDIATSIAAAGKLELAADKGATIPSGWALDKDGNPTTDPRRAAILLPVGGYKGSGLALMFECMSSLMVGNPMLEPALFGEEGAARFRQNSVVAAINIGAFTDEQRYREHVDRLIEGLKVLPRAEGIDEIFVPGECEDRVYDDRIRNGIPLPPRTLKKLQILAERFGVALPFAQ